MNRDDHKPVMSVTRICDTDHKLTFRGDRSSRAKIGVAEGKSMFSQQDMKTCEDDEEFTVRGSVRNRWRGVLSDTSSLRSRPRVSRKYSEILERPKSKSTMSLICPSAFDGLLTSKIRQGIDLHRHDGGEKSLAEMVFDCGFLGAKGEDKNVAIQMAKNTRSKMLFAHGVFLRRSDPSARDGGDDQGHTEVELFDGNSEVRRRVCFDEHTGGDEEETDRTHHSGELSRGRQSC